MHLHLRRLDRQPEYTAGALAIDGSYFCATMEDTDRNLMVSDPLQHIQKIKVRGRTAIPMGIYYVDMTTVSPRLSRSAFYQEVCSGRVPRLKHVPGFDGVLIHCGNTAADTEGCILVGKDSGRPGFISDSRNTFRHLYAAMLEAHQRGEKITLQISH